MPYYQDQMIVFSEIYINCPIYSYRTHVLVCGNPGHYYSESVSVKVLKLFRILVILWGVSATF